MSCQRLELIADISEKQNQEQNDDYSLENMDNAYYFLRGNWKDNSKNLAPVLSANIRLWL